MEVYRSTSPNEPGAVYVGPMPLLEALEAAQPTPDGRSSIRLAETVPDGVFVAVRTKSGKIWIRRKTRLSGRLGSVEDTGGWREYHPSDPQDWVPGQWRPL